MPGTRHAVRSGIVRVALVIRPVPRLSHGSGPTAEPSTAPDQIEDLLPAGPLLVLDRRDSVDQPFMNISRRNIRLIDDRSHFGTKTFGAIRLGGGRLRDRRRS